MVVQTPTVEKKLQNDKYPEWKLLNYPPILTAGNIFFGQREVKMKTSMNKSILGMILATDLIGKQE